MVQFGEFSIGPGYLDVTSKAGYHCVCVTERMQSSRVATCMVLCTFSYEKHANSALLPPNLLKKLPLNISCVVKICQQNNLNLGILRIQNKGLDQSAFFDFCAGQSHKIMVRVRVETLKVVPQVGSARVDAAKVAS